MRDRIDREIRDEVDAAVSNAFYAEWAILDMAVERWTRAGFDPRDVRQAAEEALENLRAG